METRKYIEGTDGPDTLTGTDGDDQIDGYFNHWAYDPGAGGAIDDDDTIYGLGGDDWLIGGNGDDYLDGGPGNDWLQGDEGDDHLIGGAGYNSFNGGAGTNVIDNRGGALDSVAVLGDPKGSSMYVGVGTHYGSDGAELFLNGDIGSIVYAGGGNDVIQGGWTGSSTYNGTGLVAHLGDGDDRVSYYEFFDGQSYYGDDGYDVFVWDSYTRAVGNLKITHDGDGFIIDREGTSLRLEGFEELQDHWGNSYYFGPELLSNEANHVNFSLLNPEQRLAAQTLLTNGQADLLYDALDGSDVVQLASPGATIAPGVSWQGNRFFAAGKGADTITGSFGVDWIDGGEGNDVLDGKDGNDRFKGGSGADKLTGGLGRDMFEFTGAAESAGGDVITDLNLGVVQTLQFDKAPGFLTQANLDHLQITGKDGQLYVFQGSAKLAASGYAQMAYFWDQSVPGKPVTRIVLDEDGDGARDGYIDIAGTFLIIPDGPGTYHAVQTTGEVLYLDFDNPARAPTLTTLFGNTYSKWADPTVTGDLSELSGNLALQAQVVAKTQEIFDSSVIPILVTNIRPDEATLARSTTVKYASRFTTDDQGRLVYAGLGGQAFEGIDRFNAHKGNEVAVMTGGDLSMEQIAENSAHEAGHSYGLRHINPLEGNAIEVMDYQFQSGLLETFYAAQASIVESPVDYTPGATNRTEYYAGHNNVYHLLHYVLGYSQWQILADRGISPALYDRPELPDNDVVFHFAVSELGKIVVVKLGANDSGDGGYQFLSEVLVQPGEDIALALPDFEGFQIFGYRQAGDALPSYLLGTNGSSGAVTTFHQSGELNGAGVVFELDAGGNVQGQAGSFEATPAADGTIYGTLGADVLTGGSTSELILALDGNDTLIGGGGADLLVGGLGDDIYFVDSADDTVVENSGQGRDRLVAFMSFNLAAMADVETIETDTFTGSGAIDLTGNAVSQTIYGNNGINRLDGQGGDDTLHGFGGADYLYGATGLDNLYGGAGDDHFYIAFADGDRVWEFDGEGYDVVSTEVDYELPDVAYVERLEAGTLSAASALYLGGSNLANLIIGNAGSNTLRGFAGDDTLQGLGGDDVLIGDEGADVMYGGTGNDTYYVGTSDDRVFENVGEGTADRVATSVSFTLSQEAEIEILEAVNLSGTSIGELGGSSYANTIMGDAGNNLLRGYAGNDILNGYLGNDTLMGDEGDDTMIGGAGNDVYFVDSAGDVVIENAGEGSDRVATSISYTLSATAEIETLETTSLSGTASIDLTGSNSDNLIIGNNGANVINGWAGLDVLIGYGGTDTFVFNAGLDASNMDRIEDFVSGTDKIALENAVFTALSPGSFTGANFATGTAAADADDRIVYDSATGALYYDADGTGAGAQVQFALLNGHPMLAASDFVVI